MKRDSLSLMVVSVTFSLAIRCINQDFVRMTAGRLADHETARGCRPAVGR